MIWLARHGQTLFNAQARLQGRIDSPLTELGLAQAARVGAFFAGRTRDDPGRWRVSHSPLGRAAHTARIIAAAAGLTAALEPEPRLVELSIGSWEGQSRAELEAIRPDLAGQFFFMRSPDGEPWAESSARIGGWLADWAEREEVDVIAVSHAGAGKVLRALYLGLSIDEARSLDTPQDAVYRLHGGAIERFDCP